MALLGTLGGGAARTAAVSLAGLGLFVVNQSGMGTLVASTGVVKMDRRDHLGLRGGDLDPTRAVEGNLNDDGEGEPSAMGDVDVPGCARDVFVTLHRKEGGGPACHGLLVRDDIVVTSAACSHLEHTFDFPGHGTVEATPHATLNERSARKAPGSRLGFLEARPPFDHYHHRYAGERVRRTRVFLSMNANPDANGAESDMPVAMTCTDDDRPVAHNFPVNGEMIPLGQLADAVPQDVLWDDDIDTAPMLSYKTHRWYTRYVDLDDEQDKLDELMDRFEGPPGGVSLPDVEDNYDGRMSGLLEALDPRGHRHLDCFRNYFHRYRREHPFSGTHFFDWLDFGKGKFLLERNQKQKTFRRMKGDANCHKKEFNRSFVEKLE